MQRTLAVLAMVGLLAGCTHISNEAMGVAVHRQYSTMLDDCEKLGPVSCKTSAWGHLAWDEVRQQAANDLRQVAWDKYQADTVVLLNVDLTANWAYAHGVAFRCYEKR